MPSIRILDIRLLDVAFSINRSPEELPDEVSLDFGCNVSSSYEEKEKRILVKLRVYTKDDDQVKFPFRFDILIAGLFQLDSEPDENLRQQLKTVNCPAMVFPYARELVSDLTKRAGLSPLYLPVVNFVRQAGENFSEAPRNGDIEAKPLKKPKKVRKDQRNPVS